MTPQEKAKELVEKYYQSNLNYWFNKNTSKKCAKIAVQEIISAIDWHEFETPNKELEFWNEVLKEIDNL
jgi:uncharacterized protein (DUF169 family)